MYIRQRMQFTDKLLNIALEKSIGGRTLVEMAMQKHVCPYSFTLYAKTLHENNFLLVF